MQINKYQLYTKCNIMIWNKKVCCQNKLFLLLGQ